MNYHKERKTVSFSVAKVRCMDDYVQPTLREAPSHVILHVGTDDVTTKQDPQQIAKVSLT